MSRQTGHLEPAVIAGYRQRTLDPADLLRAGDHLAQCAACRDRVADVERLGRAAAEVRADLEVAGADGEHPSSSQIADFVDGMLDEVDRELMEAHLEICGSCAEDAADLVGLRRELPQGGLAAVERPRRWPAFAAAALAAGLAGVLIWSWLRPGQERFDTSAAPPRAAGVQAGSASPGAVPVAILSDGAATLTLHADGTLSGLPALREDEAAAVRLALEEGRVALPASLRDLHASPGTLMGANRTASSAFQPRRPVGTAVTADRPAFEWTALEGAGEYVVSVFDLDFNKVAESPPISGIRWRPAAPLGRGRTYVWQVRTSAGGEDVVSPAPPSPEARFRVLSLVEMNRLRAARARLGDSHLAMGVLLGEAGALDEAERELEQLAAANPGAHAPLTLLNHLREQRSDPARRR